MPPKRVRKSRSRQTTPQSPPKQQEPSVSPRQTRRSTRSHSHEVATSPAQLKQTGKSGKSLPIVNEEPAVEDEEAGDAPEDALSDIEHPQSTSDDQILSEDDVDDASSHDTTQLEALDIDLIVDNLSAIHLVAAQILSLLDFKDISNVLLDANNPGSRRSVRLHNFVLRFNACREAYGSGSYIDIPLVLRKLVHDRPLNDGPWRPDAVLQLANLSLLMSELAHTNETALYDTLERMFNTFPEPFGRFEITTGSTRYSTQLVTETVSFGIDLKTQFFLKFLDRNPASDPDSVLRDTFYDEDGNLDGFQDEGEEISQIAEEAILERLETIRSFFRKTSEGSIDLNQLKSKYSWHRFLREALRWTSLRKQELETEIAAQGGVQTIENLLRNDTLNSYDPNTPYAQATPERPETVVNKRQDQMTELAPGTPKTPIGSRSAEAERVARKIAQYRVIRRQEEEQSSEDEQDDPEIPEQQLAQKQAPMTESSKRPDLTVYEIPQSPGIAADGEAEQVVGDTEDNLADIDNAELEPPNEPLVDSSPPKPTQSSIVPTQQTLAVLEVARQQAALGNKENIDITRRYTDKQPNAKRLEWNDSQPGQKRAREDAESEDYDDDFEVDIRPQKRRRIPRLPPPNAADDWLAEEGDDDNDELGEQAARQLRDDALHSSPRHRPPPSTQPQSRRSPLHQRQNEAPSSSAPQLRTTAAARSPPRSLASVPNGTASNSIARKYKEAQAEAKAVTRLRPLIDNTYPQVRPPQTRRPWSDEETKRLIESIALFGCSWSRILAEDAEHRDGPRLQSRGQVMLKDRARHMKFVYLKGGKDLPPGFTAVTMGKKEKETLKALGIPWQSAKEDDQESD